MQRDEYFRIKKIPLLIGGATTSRVHTAVKIAPHYDGPVVYVPDASRSVGVCSDLLSRRARRGLHRRARGRLRARARAARQQEGDAAGHARRGARQQDADRLGALHAAGAEVHRPARVQEPRPGRDSPSYIDWGPFFQTWDLAGPYPAILNDEIVGESARRVLSDGQRMLQAPDRGPLAHAPTASIGLCPANTRQRRRHRDLHRRVAQRGAADLARPAHADRAAGGRRRDAARTAASPTSSRRRARAWPTTSACSPSPPASASRRRRSSSLADLDDYSAIMLKALADRLAEAFAERLHQRVRTDLWGYAADEALDDAGADRREVPRHPAGAGLSGLPRPHRQARPVPRAAVPTRSAWR